MRTRKTSSCKCDCTSSKKNHPTIYSFDINRKHEDISTTPLDHSPSSVCCSVHGRSHLCCPTRVRDAVSNSRKRDSFGFSKFVFVNIICSLTTCSGRTVSVESPEISADDYQRAEKAIFEAVGRLEEKVQHVLEDEVDTLFHDLGHEEKESIKQEAKERVQKSAKQVRKKVEDHDHAVKKTLPSMHDSYPFPYSWPKEDPEHRILHAVEAAEKAVLHAVEEEVNTLFHESKHDDGDKKDANKQVKQVKKALKQSVEKVDKHVDAKHEHRRQNVLGDEKKFSLEDYLRFEMESME